MRKPLHKYNPNASATRTQFKRRGETRREVCSTTTTTIWTAENENESETDNTISVNQHMPRQKETMKPSWPQDFPSEKVITELVLSETFNPAGSDVSVVLFNAIREDSVLDVDDIFAASYKKHFDTMCCALDFLWEKFNHNATKKHRNRIQKIRKALHKEEETFGIYFDTQKRRLDRYEVAAGTTYMRGRPSDASGSKKRTWTTMRDSSPSPFWVGANVEENEISVEDSGAEEVDHYGTKEECEPRSEQDAPDAEGPFLSIPAIIDVPADYELLEPRDMFLTDGLNLSQHFYRFQRHSLACARQMKLTVEANAHEILALSYTLLVKPGQHSDGLLSFLSPEDLQNVETATKTAASLTEYQLSEPLEAQLRKLGKLLQKTSFSSNPEIQQAFLSHLCHYEMGTTESLLMQLFMTLARRLPFTRVRLERDSESDLIASYISLVVGEILAGDERMRAVWPNTAASVAIKEKSVQRARQPDFKLIRVHQGMEDHECGYGEVKTSSHSKDTYLLNYDLIRIARFGKQCLDSLIRAGVPSPVVPLFQVVGPHMCFYAMVLISDGLYVMLEIGSLQIPLCTKDLLGFVDEVHHLIAFRSLCCRVTEAMAGEKVSTVQVAKCLRKTLTTPQFRDILEPTKSRKRRGSIAHTR